VNQWQIDRVFEPDLSSERRDELKAGWAKAVDRTKEWETPNTA
jgi:glycerol kinase